MKVLELFILAVGLSMDAFAVALCKGMALGKVRWKQASWVGLWFGGFQGLMPLFGFLLANTFASAIEGFDHWIAFALLGIIGGNMIKESLSKEEEGEGEGCNCADLGLKAMLLLAVATSIDALAAGISLVAVVQLPLFAGGSFNFGSIWVAVAFIGIVTFILSTLGVKLGGKVGDKLGKKAELLGGCVLVLLGLKILLEHLGIITLF